MGISFPWRRILVAALWMIQACSPLIAAAESAKLLVKNARLFTMEPQQRDPFVGYFVVAQDGTILTVKPGNPPANLAAKQVIDAEGKWIIPGFISAHSHLWQAAYRGIAADKTLMDWINDIYFQKAARASTDDFYWFCLLGALDHLQNGITAAYNFNYERIDWKGEDNDIDKAEFRAEEESGIRFVHGYEPGMIHTGLTDVLLSGFDWTVPHMEAKTPLARIGTPEDVADVVVFLCSEGARFVTGQNLVVDGGMTLHGAGVDGLLDRFQTMLAPEAP